MAESHYLFIHLRRTREDLAQRCIPSRGPKANIQYASKRCFHPPCSYTDNVQPRAYPLQLSTIPILYLCRLPIDLADLITAINEYLCHIPFFLDKEKEKNI